MTLFISFLAISFIYCCSPGPTMLLVINVGISNKNRCILIGCISGIIFSNFTMVALSSLGLGVLIQESQIVFETIKFIGAIYLIYLGITSIVQSFKKTSKINNNKLSSFKLSFMQGYLTSITNPKLLLFYIAFLPQFVTGTFQYKTELFLWGLGYILIVFTVMTTYGLMASRLSSYMLKTSINKIVKRLVGVLFIGFGTTLLKYKPT